MFPTLLTGANGQKEHVADSFASVRAVLIGDRRSELPGNPASVTAALDLLLSSDTLWLFAHMPVRCGLGFCWQKVVVS